MYCHEHNGESCRKCQRKFEKIENSITLLDPLTAYPIKIDYLTCELSCGFGERPSENGMSCLNNLCNCENGQGKNKCHEHGANSCKRCHYGYSMKLDVVESALQSTDTDIYKCEKNICNCENGTAVEICNAKDRDRCKSCDVGYKLKNQRCVFIGVPRPGGVNDDSEIVEISEEEMNEQQSS